MVSAEYQTVQKFTLTNPCPPKTQQVVPGVCFVTRWGSYGNGDGQFRSVAGIDVGLESLAMYMSLMQ